MCACVHACLLLGAATLQGYDVLEDMMSPRTSASNFVTTIASKRAKQHMPPLMARLVDVMNTYAAAGAGTHTHARTHTMYVLQVEVVCWYYAQQFVLTTPRTRPGSVWPVNHNRGRTRAAQLTSRWSPACMRRTCCLAPAAKAANGGHVPEPLARQMDGALLAIGALADTLKAKVRRCACA